MLSKHFYILKMSKIFKDDFDPPPIVVFRQPPNLRSLLVSAEVCTNNRGGKGCFKIHSKRCVICNLLRETNFVKSHSTGEKFRINDVINSSTVRAIYLINCIGRNK